MPTSIASIDGMTTRKSLSVSRALKFVCGRRPDAMAGRRSCAPAGPGGPLAGLTVSAPDTIPISGQFAGGNRAFAWTHRGGGVAAIVVVPARRLTAALVKRLQTEPLASAALFLLGLITRTARPLSVCRPARLGGEVRMRCPTHGEAGKARSFGHARACRTKTW